MITTKQLLIIVMACLAMVSFGWLIEHIDVTNKIIDCNNQTNYLNDTLTILYTNQSLLQEELRVFECPQCEICQEIPVCEPEKLSDADRQRYTIRIKTLEHQLGLFNDTEAYSKLYNNHTNLKYEFEECNETLTAVIELVN